MKIALLFVLGVSASAQGWGRREAMRPWLQGTFSDAAQTFANMRGTLAGEPQPLLWQAEFEIERARFSDAAALINGARRIATYDLATLPERRLARLLLETGRFREAQTVALEGRQWDGRNIEKLKSYSPMALVTLGELAFLKGDFSVATSILEKARDKARSASSLDGLEYIRSQIWLARSHLADGSTQTASQAISVALNSAEREWGPNSVPAMDALDAMGIVQTFLSDLAGAERSFTRSRSRREMLYGLNHPKVAQSYLHAALLCARQGNKIDILRLVRRGLEIEKALAVGPNGRWAMALLDGAEILASVGETDETRTCYASAIPVLEEVLGPDVPRVNDARKRNAGIRQQ